jgi:hypothetical protein
MNSLLTEVFPSSDKIFQTVTVRKLLWDGVTVVNCAGDQLSPDASMICSVLKPELPVYVTEHEPGIFKLAYLRHVSLVCLHLLQI